MSMDTEYQRENGHAGKPVRGNATFLFESFAWRIEHFKSKQNGACKLSQHGLKFHEFRRT